MSFLSSILPIVGTIGGGIIGGPAGASIGASLGGALGGGMKGGSNGAGSAQGIGGNSTNSGFAALPPEVQQAYLQKYLPQLLQQTQGKFQGTPTGQAPTGPFASQALQELQQYSNQNGGIFGGNSGVNPLGQVEPFNQYQQNALGSFGGGLSGFQNELPGYQNLYNENVLNPQLAEIDYQNGIANSNLRSNEAGRSVGAFGNTAFGSQLAGQQDNANRLKLGARAQAFQGAQELRNRTLQEMLGAGGVIQQQNQQSLNALQPQLQQATPGAQLGALQKGLGAFPNSTVGQHYGQAIPGTPNFASQLGGFGDLALSTGAKFGLPGFGGAGGNTGSSWSDLLGGNSAAQTNAQPVNYYKGGNYNFGSF